MRNCITVLCASGYRCHAASNDRKEAVVGTGEGERCIDDGDDDDDVNCLCLFWKAKRSADVAVI